MHLPNFEDKIIPPANLASLAFKRKLVFTNGCFDILHRGHVTYLAQAAALGNSLIVALNTDESVKAQNKSPQRPINCLADRLAVIASLACVDYVTYFASDTPLQLILSLLPDVLVKGGDWSIAQIVGSREILANGGQVHSIPFLHNCSTTQLIKKINNV